MLVIEEYVCGFGPESVMGNCYMRTWRGERGSICTFSFINSSLKNLVSYVLASNTPSLKCKGNGSYAACMAALASSSEIWRCLRNKTYKITWVRTSIQYQGTNGGRFIPSNRTVICHTVSALTYDFQIILFHGRDS